MPVVTMEQDGIFFTTDPAESRNVNLHEEKDLETIAVSPPSVSDPGATGSVWAAGCGGHFSKRSEQDERSRKSRNKKQKKRASLATAAVVGIVAVAACIAGVSRAAGRNGAARERAPPSRQEPADVPPRGIYLNAGGRDVVTDEAGNEWIPDDLAIADRTVALRDAGGVQSRNCPLDVAGVPDSVPAELYCTDRWFPRGAAETYEIPVARQPAAYAVTLHFAETFFTEPDKRVMEVWVEGVRVEDHLDIIAEAGGPNTALQVTKEVVVEDGVLDVDLIALTQNAKINAIEVHPVVSSQRDGDQSGKQTGDDVSPHQ
jgi:hypothetical protein